MQFFFWSGFRTIHFQNFIRWLWTHSTELFLTLQKVESYHAYHNSIVKKWGSPSLFLSYKSLKLKLKVFLAGHIVAKATYCTTILTATCSLTNGKLFITMSLASTNIEWLQWPIKVLVLGITGNCFWATFN